MPHTRSSRRRPADPQAACVPRVPQIRALRGIPAGDLRGLQRSITEISRRREVKFYPREGVFRYIPIALYPWLLTAAQKHLFADLFAAIDEATRLMVSFRRSRTDVQKLLPLSDTEERWMRDWLPDDRPFPQTNYGRVDVHAPLWEADWEPRLRVIETNMVGIGAIYYCHCANRIADEVLRPVWEPLLPGWKLSAEDEVLDILAAKIHRHAVATGRTGRRVVLMEEDCLMGPYEFVTMAPLLKTRGIQATPAAPGQLEARGNEVLLRGEPVDVVYRDSTVNDLAAMASEGADLAGVEQAFRLNRVVSGLSGELDHKGVLDVFTWPPFRAGLSAGARRVLERHLAWTRLIRPGHTTDPSGRRCDLPEFTRKNRAGLLIKPNRDYGGHGLLFGCDAKAGEWDRAIERGIREPGGWVVQEALPRYETEYPEMKGGRKRLRKMHNICGFAAEGERCAMLGRVAPERVVNITHGGSMAGVLVARERGL